MASECQDSLRLSLPRHVLRSRAGGDQFFLCSFMGCKRIFALCIAPWRELLSRIGIFGTAESVSLTLGLQECPIVQQVYLSQTQYFTYNASQAGPVA